MHNMKFVAARPCLHASTAAALERHCHGAPRAPLHAVWAGGRWPAMGKCYKCTSAQASYYDPDNGPGRYCKQCAKTVPGAVSRWQKDKQKAAANIGAGRGSGIGDTSTSMPEKMLLQSERKPQQPAVGYS